MSSVVLKTPTKDIKKESLGLKEESAYFYETYYPIHFDKYVTFCCDNEYRYWPEVFELVASSLSKRGIGFINISKVSTALDGKCFKADSCTLRQAAYLLSESLLNISAQDWSLSLSCNNEYPRVFANTKDRSFSVAADEYDEGINDLCKPEEVAAKIFQKLSINDEIQINTLFIGESFDKEIIEFIPNFNIQRDQELDNNKTYGIRCDLCPNWVFVKDVCSMGVQPFVTATDIPPPTIMPFLSNIKQMSIFVNDKITPEQLRNLDNNGINYILISKSDEIDHLKVKFFDFKPIIVLEPTPKEHIDKLKKMPYDTMLRSNRMLVNQRQRFMSVYHFNNNLPVDSPSNKGLMLGEAYESEDFLDEYELFLYYEKA